MEIQVFAVSQADKSKTFVRQFFDRAFGHLHKFLF
jgi:hypothetical protein